MTRIAREDVEQAQREADELKTLDAVEYAAALHRAFCQQNVRDAADVLGGEVEWGRERR